MTRLSTLIAIGLLAAPSAAAGYPYFQFSSGTKTCSLCHVAPAGGGLLTRWGRDQSGDAVSFGGDGAFLHGLLALPDALTIGGDIRLAALVNETGNDTASFAVFPMQADLAAQARAGSWSVVGSIGLNGAARDAELSSDSERDQAGPASYIVSREHYLYWRKRSARFYARAGRFYAPFGLRLPDHTAFVRRTTGFNLLEETYGLSAGYLGRDSELHVTAFVSDQLRWAPRREAGIAVMPELRLGSTALGLSVRGAASDVDTRATGGPFVKAWIDSWNVLWMAEADATWQSFRDVDGGSRVQLAAYAGPVWIPTQGVYLAVAYELFDEDLLVRDVERHAVSSWVSVLPLAHVEVTLSGRAQKIGPSDRALMTMLQLHYYL